jgi:hypothetical protein
MEPEPTCQSQMPLNCSRRSLARACDTTDGDVMVIIHRRFSPPTCTAASSLSSAKAWREANSTPVPCHHTLPLLLYRSPPLLGQSSWSTSHRTSLISLCVKTPQASALIRPRCSLEKESPSSCRLERISDVGLLHRFPGPAEPSMSFSSPMCRSPTSPALTSTPPSASHWRPPLPKTRHRRLPTLMSPLLSATPKSIDRLICMLPDHSPLHLNAGSRRDQLATAAWEAMAPSPVFVSMGRKDRWTQNLSWAGLTATAGSDHMHSSLFLFPFGLI